MRKEKVSGALTLFLLMLTVWGCGGPADPSREITGTWQRNVASGTASFVGLLTLERGGSFYFTFEGKAVGHESSEGSFRLTGRDIKFEDKSCKGVGRYRYLIKDSTLAFIPLADGCARRKAVLAGEWRKREAAETRTY